jgi:hypothetical protein
VRSTSNPNADKILSVDLAQVRQIGQEHALREGALLKDLPTGAHAETVGRIVLFNEHLAYRWGVRERERDASAARDQLPAGERALALPAAVRFRYPNDQ